MGNIGILLKSLNVKFEASLDKNRNLKLSNISLSDLKDIMI